MGPESINLSSESLHFINCFFLQKVFLFQKVLLFQNVFLFQYTVTMGFLPYSRWFKAILWKLYNPMFSRKTGDVNFWFSFTSGPRNFQRWIWKKRCHLAEKSHPKVFNVSKSIFASNSEQVLLISLLEWRLKPSKIYSPKLMKYLRKVAIIQPKNVPLKNWEPKQFSKFKNVNKYFWTTLRL